jgi:hypothetical protein
MGLITGYNKNNFVSGEQIYSKIRREFKSFTGSNLIDDGEFPVYTSEIINFLGNSALLEAHAVIELEDGKAKLPTNFKEFHSASRCTLDNSKSEIWRGQGQTVIRQDTSCIATTDCSICCNTKNNTQTVTTQMFIKDTVVTNVYSNFKDLVLSPNVGNDNRQSRENEITINEGYIHANFSGNIYLEYYAFPLDCDGLPLVPDNLKIQKAIEWYIKYQILLNFWFSDDVSNIQNKWSKAEQEYNKWLNEARHESKLPSFSTLMNEARNKRANNMVTFFSRQYRN